MEKKLNIDLAVLERNSGAMIGAFMSCCIGFISWRNQPLALAVAPLIAFFWANAENRKLAFLNLFGYYLCASRGLIFGIGVFYNETNAFVGLSFWMASSVLLALPWALFWTTDKSKYWYRLLLILAVVSAPPLGIIGWANPLTAAGIIFPRTAFYGLVATYALMVLFCHMKSHRQFAVLSAFVFSTALLIGAIINPPGHSHIKGINTALSGVGGQYDFLKSYENNLSLVKTASSETSNILFPESVAGLWLSATADLWKNRIAPGRFAFVGAAEPLQNGYNNVIVAVSGSVSDIVYRQRIPVPFGMWHPWSGNSAIAHFLDDGVFTFDEKRYGALICYEQLLMWPVLQTYFQKPDVVLAPTNSWWAKGTSIPSIQKSIMIAWSNLFGVPAVTAFNF